MIHKNYLVLFIFIIMFSLFNKVDAKYERLFFELSIKNINGEKLDLKQFKKKNYSFSKRCK